MASFLSTGICIWVGGPLQRFFPSEVFIAFEKQPTYHNLSFHSGLQIKPVSRAHWGEKGACGAPPSVGSGSSHTAHSGLLLIRQGMVLLSFSTKTLAYLAGPAQRRKGGNTTENF